MLTDKSRYDVNLQVTLCDPYLSALEAFAKTSYTNRHYLYFTFTLNASLQDGQLHLYRSMHVWTPLLKMAGLDADEMNNYRPVLHLTFTSLSVEKAVST